MAQQNDKQKQLLTEVMNADAKDGLYKQQTAVEWLAIQLYEKMNMSGDGNVFDEIVSQAKQMEKEQIINAWASGVVSKNDMTAEQYYNETYEGNT